MSLIRCDECGKEISDKSSVCIHCGNLIYKEEHTNVVLLERSWIDLAEEEKIALVCEYEEKTGISMHFTFWECCFWHSYLICFGMLSLIGSLVAMTEDGLSGFGFFLVSVGMVCLGSFLSYNTWQKYRGEVSWNRVNFSREFTKWLKACKNIVK